MERKPNKNKQRQQYSTSPLVVLVTTNKKQLHACVLPRTLQLVTTIYQAQVAFNYNNKNNHLCCLLICCMFNFSNYENRFVDFEQVMSHIGKEHFFWISRKSVLSRYPRLSVNPTDLSKSDRFCRLSICTISKAI